MGRKTLGVDKVNTMDASAEAKERLRVTLEVIAGRKSVEEACEVLGIGASRFDELRTEALRGALGALEPGCAGRPPRQAEPSAEVEALQAQVAELRIDLAAALVREEIALTMPGLLRPPATEKKTAENQELFARKRGTSKGSR